MMSSLLAKMMLLLPALLVFCVAASDTADNSVVNTRGRTVGTIAELNRVNFYQNIRDASGPAHWVVLYCVDWYPACHSVREAYLDFASTYERKHNAETLFQLQVRFAEVKCTVDKPLCNEQGVQMYPQVVHYRGGEQVGVWSGGGGKDAKEVEKLGKFLAKEMDFVAGEVLDPETTEEPRTWIEILLDLPVAQQNPLQTMLHLAPYVAALIGMAYAIGGQFVEVVRTRRRMFREARRLDPDQCKEEPKKAEEQPQPEKRTGLRSRLPEAWARQRPSIEL